ncbi:MAG: hypothetical protein J2P18_02755 [Nocardia sp.]|nr:hypothetical protein [Nocardia sp.]
MIAVASIAGVLVAAACSRMTESADPIQAPQPAATSSPTGTPSMVALPGSLAADFAALRPSLGGQAAMAVMAVGGASPVVMGDWSTGPAWSTMKVPLTLAVLHGNGDTATAQMSQAITESDNSAADALWQSLGSGDDAARAVQQVLREGGDNTTTVPTNRPRADYSAFGQAGWALADQIRFTADLPCLRDADTVTSLMGKVVSGQQWGLGRLDSTKYKGGWGPDQNGNYLVRQIGLLSTPAGDVAVALAAQSNSGSFDAATRMLNQMASLLTKHLPDLPAGRCVQPR